MAGEKSAGADGQLLEPRPARLPDPSAEDEKAMRVAKQIAKSMLAAALLAAPLAVTACATRQVYDPYYSQTYRWDRAEEGRYERWEVETHRTHLEFSRRPTVDQHAYFDWRHSHQE
jgi:hypothetical protein